MIGQTGPDFLPIDPLLIALASRTGFQRRQIRARTGFGIANRKVALALQDLRQVGGLLRWRTELEQCRTDCIQGQYWNRKARTLNFIKKNKLFDGPTLLTAL